MTVYPKLQYISQGITAADQYRNIVKVLEEGCTWVQLRWKGVAMTEFKELIQKVSGLKQYYTFTFILNDHAELATLQGIDGVHLGLEDMPVASARCLSKR